MVDYEPSCGALAVIADSVRPIPGGVAKHVFHLGDSLILRIPRTEQFVLDLAKEAAVIPAARDAGVRTPEVIAFDDTCAEVNAPWTDLV